MFWAIVIGLAILFVVIDVIKWFMGGIDSSMDNFGLTPHQKDNAWWGIGMFSDFWNHRK